jgi:hypothetical protein
MPGKVTETLIFAEVGFSREQAKRCTMVPSAADLEGQDPVSWRDL